MRQQEYGLQNIMYSTFENGMYTPLEVIIGANSASYSEGGSGETLMRDGQVEFELPSAESSTIEFAVSQFPNKFREKHLGHRKVNGFWVEGFDKLPFYLVYFRKVFSEEGDVYLKAEIYPSCTVIANTAQSAQTDEASDLGFTARVDLSPNAMTDGVMQSHMSLYSNDPDGEYWINELLNGNVVFPQRAVAMASAE